MLHVDISDAAVRFLLLADLVGWLVGWLIGWMDGFGKQLSGIDIVTDSILFCFVWISVFLYFLEGGPGML